MAPLFLARNPEEADSLLSWWEGEHLAPEAQLSVGMDEVALFVEGDRLVHTLGPGRHALSATSHPELARYLEKTLFRKPPAISVAFAKTTPMVLDGSGDLEPTSDPATGEPVQPRIDLRFRIQAKEPGKLVALLDELGEGETCEDWIAEEVFARAAEAIAQSGRPVSQLSAAGAHTEVAADTLERANGTLAPFGVSLLAPPELELTLEPIDDGDEGDDSAEDEDEDAQA